MLVMKEKNKLIQWRGKLFGCGQDAKTVKSNKAGQGILTAIMYLKPFMHLGYNSCSNAALASCHVGCLFSAGRGRFENVIDARTRKTEWFIKNREAFLDAMRRDIEKFSNWAIRKGYQPAYRPNGTSDIRWENHDVIQQFPEVQAYDYTKIANRKNLPDNYHLTFSYSESNRKYMEMSIKARDRGMNLAAVFRDKDNIPKEFLGLPVISGDENDLRFLDPKNHVISLYAKGLAKKDNTGFVIDA